MVKHKELRLSASTRVGVYPPGSTESRAAARQLIDARRAKLGAGMVLRIIGVGPERGIDEEVDLSKCTCLQPKAGEVVLCKCFLIDNFEVETHSTPSQK